MLLLLSWVFVANLVTGSSSGAADKIGSSAAAALSRVGVVGTPPFHFVKEAASGGKLTVVDGEKHVRLDCSVSTNENVEYRWEYNGIQLSNTTRRYQTGSNLIIAPAIKDRDEGNFTCVAKDTRSAFSLSSPPFELYFVWIGATTVAHLASPETDVKHGGEATLKCHVEGNSHIVFRWYRNGLVVDGHDKLLHLSNLRNDNSGSYTCTATNDAASATPLSVVHVSVPDENIPKLITGPTNLFAMQGETVRFDCEFLEIETRVQWFKLDTKLENAGRFNILGNGSLVITYTEQTDAGMYKCRGTSRKVLSGMVEYSAYLQIAYLEPLTLDLIDMPMDRVDGTKIGVGAGQRIELHCRPPGGIPTPQIHWEDLQGRQVTRGRGAVSPRSGLLVIDKMENSLAGSYTCVARNKAGVERITVQILLTSVASIVSHPKPVIVSEDDSTSLTCLVKAGDLAKVRWRRNGVGLPANGGDDGLGPKYTENFEKGQNRSTLVMKQVRLADAGDYSCEIITPGFPNVHSRPAQLFVTEKLKFSPTPVDRKLELGSYARIHCRAYGNPKPTIRWFKPKEHDPFHQLPSDLIDANGTLHFPNVSMADAGRYICVASNSQEFINTTIRVEVVSPPKFVLVTDNPMEAMEAMPIVMECQAVGDPMPTIQWDRDKNLNGLDRSRFHAFKNGTLIINPVRREDDGFYGCTAGNSGGLIREEIRLIVIRNDDDFGTDEFSESNVMTRTVVITLSVASSYMVLVIGLMLWCRYRQIRRKQAYLHESQKEQGDAEMKEQSPVNQGVTGPLLQNHKPKKIGSGDSVKSEGDTGKSTHSSVCNGRAASATASVASHRSQISAHSKRSCSSVYDRLAYHRSQLQFVMLLGHGEFGEVFLARGKKVKDNEAESLVMIKSLQTRDEASLLNYKQEIDMYYKLNHDNVAMLLKLSREADPHYMIMEYSDWGDFKQFLLATRKQSVRKVPQPPVLTMHQILQVVSQVALGMEHLSNNRFIHKDLATRNCLIFSGLRIKISNPALSKDTYAAEYCTYKNQNIPLRWMPSEAVLDDDYSTKSDVWAFGVLVWEVIHQAPLPLEKRSNQDIISCHEKQERLWEDKSEVGVKKIPDQLLELLQTCWHVCPTNRPSFSAIAIKLDEIIRQF